ncbi:MAG: DUF2851 family protein [Bacteroidia bacterium]|nr:DUF2851 family protein [Bacteroidia bacterium]HQV00747.1 DUF2851 family protein [Bacteroidia bacterium]
MTEALLHHIWKFKLFNTQNLLTSDGQSVAIMHPGKHNTDQGPDFFDARIKINDTLWAGNVELHLKTSDWQKHFHQNDAAYNNVILHVVFEHDITLIKAPAIQQQIPVLALNTCVGNHILKQYDNLMLNQYKIPCNNMANAIDGFIWANWHDRLMVERMEHKTQAIESLLIETKNNWEESFYILLARNFGFKINALPFELLARSLPLNCLAKHKNNLHQIEALLFGQAGLLQNKLMQDYGNALRDEYFFLQKKFELTPLQVHLWKFMRLRPANFPTIRLAQFAQLIHNSSHLFSKLISVNNISDAYACFDVTASAYWNSHFVFDKTIETHIENASQSRKLGKMAIENIIINTLIPFMFYYGKQKGITAYQQQAFDFLNQIPAEQNHIVKKFTTINLPCTNAYQAQAYIQLYNYYCSHKKCLSCAIGNKIIKND